MSETLTIERSYESGTKCFYEKRGDGNSTQTTFGFFGNQFGETTQICSMDGDGRFSFTIRGAWERAEFLKFVMEIVTAEISYG